MRYFKIQELSDEIEDYTHRFNTEDQVEWNLVLQEVAAFIEVSFGKLGWVCGCKAGDRDWGVCVKKQGLPSFTSPRPVLQADPVMVLNDDNTIVITSNRLTETGAPLLEQGMIVGQLSLADALIIGNCNNQVKNCEGNYG